MYCIVNVLYLIFVTLNLFAYKYWQIQKDENKSQLSLGQTTMDGLAKKIQLQQNLTHYKVFCESFHQRIPPHS